MRVGPGGKSQVRLPRARVDVRGGAPVELLRGDDRGREPQFVARLGRAVRDAARGGHGDRARAFRRRRIAARGRLGSKNSDARDVPRPARPIATGRASTRKLGDEERRRDWARRGRRPHARGGRNARATLRTRRSRRGASRALEPTALRPTAGNPGSSRGFPRTGAVCREVASFGAASRGPEPPARAWCASLAGFARATNATRAHAHVSRLPQAHERARGC